MKRTSKSLLLIPLLGRYYREIPTSPHTECRKNVKEFSIFCMLKNYAYEVSELRSQYSPEMLLSLTALSILFWIVEYPKLIRSWKYLHLE